MILTYTIFKLKKTVVSMFAAYLSKIYTCKVRLKHDY